MRVGLDVTAAFTDRPSGVARAIRGIFGALDGSIGEWEIVPLARPLRWRPFRRIAGRAGRACRTRILRRRLDGRHRLDLFHGLDARLPLDEGLPLVATIHDLAALEAGLSTEAFRTKRLRQWEDAVERAARIVTYSRFVRDRVVDRLGVADQRVAVVPLGLDPVFIEPPPDERSERTRRLGIEGRYVLNVGGLSRRKGTTVLLEAFAGVREADLRLVICGRDGHGAEESRDAIGRLGLCDRVVLLGHVADDRDLAALYARATAVVLPSPHEGFGLAALEAMACGAPVIAAIAGAMPETTGDAARLVPAGDPSALGSAISAVVGDEALRLDLSARGRRRAAWFTWAETANGMIGLYLDLLDEKDRLREA